MRRGLLYWLAVFGLQVMAWVSATSRLLEPINGHNDNDHVHPPGVVVSSEFCNTQSSFSSIERPRNRVENGENAWKKKGEFFKETKKIGSRPPNCDSKCYGCTPCVAIQVPAATSHFSLQYANYLPEGWKCKCGPSFYSP